MPERLAEVLSLPPRDGALTIVGAEPPGPGGKLITPGFPTWQAHSAQLNATTPAREAGLPPTGTSGIENWPTPQVRTILTAVPDLVPSVVPRAKRAPLTYPPGSRRALEAAAMGIPTPTQGAPDVNGRNYRPDGRQRTQEHVLVHASPIGHALPPMPDLSPPRPSPYGPFERGAPDSAGSFSHGRRMQEVREVVAEFGVVAAAAATEATLRTPRGQTSPFLNAPREITERYLQAHPQAQEEPNRAPTQDRPQTLPLSRAHLAKRRAWRIEQIHGGQSIVKVT